MNGSSFFHDLNISCLDITIIQKKTTPGPADCDGIVTHTPADTNLPEVIPTPAEQLTAGPDAAAVVAAERQLQPGVVTARSLLRTQLEAMRVDCTPGLQNRPVPRHTRLPLLVTAPAERSPQPSDRT